MTAEREGLVEEIARVLGEHDWRADDTSEYAMPCRHVDHHFHAFCGICSGDVRVIADALADLLAARDRRVRGEALREAAEATEQFAEEVYGEHFFRRPTKQDYAEINALLKRERGHQLDGIGADCYHHALTVRAEMLREMAAEIEAAE